MIARWVAVRFALLLVQEAEIKLKDSYRTIGEKMVTAAVDDSVMTTETSREATWESTWRPRLKLASWNICDGRNGNLEAAARGLEEMKTDLAIVFETKTGEAYTRSASGYKIIASESDGKKGGIGVLQRDARWWHTEGLRFLGPNVVTMELFYGDKEWTVIGAYLPPSEEDDGPSLASLIKALEEAPNEIILVGDFNINFDAPRNQREDTIINDIFGVGRRLTNAAKCFRWARQRGRWTWQQSRNGEMISSVVDYVWLERAADLTSLKLKQPRYCNTDHRCYLGELAGKTSKYKTYQKYRSARKKYPLEFKKESEADKLLDELKRETKSDKKKINQQKSWMTEETWKIMDKRRRAAQQQKWDEHKTLKKDLRRAMRQDRKNRQNDVGEKFSTNFAGGNMRKAYSGIRGWYRKRTGDEKKPTVREMTTIHNTYKNLFTESTSEKEEIPILVEPTMIDDEVPSEQEIRDAVKQLRNFKSPGASGIKVENLKLWAAESEITEEEERTPRRDRWEKLMRIVELAFQDAEIPDAFMNAVLVLIPKHKPGEYRGIALLEVLYKLCTTIITRRLQDSVQFHDCIHGFRRKRGTATATIETKLKMQLAFRQQIPYFQVFIDLKKAYDTLDRKQTIKILEGYGVGPRTIRLLKTIWSGDKCVPELEASMGPRSRKREE